VEEKKLLMGVYFELVTPLRRGFLTGGVRDREFRPPLLVLPRADNASLKRFLKIVNTPAQGLTVFSKRVTKNESKFDF
jgi:hypothetical protein